MGFREKMLGREKFWEVCRTREDLRNWVKGYLGIWVPVGRVCEGHEGPMEYLWRAYREPAGDVVVWGPRGGGKTRLGAVATLLDLVHKPGCSVRVLAGSLEQSLKMWGYLMGDLRKLIPDEIVEERGGRVVRVKKTGSSAAVLAQSECAVRGTHVQKMRCDEVEMFREEVWEAAQLVTKSLVPESSTNKKKALTLPSSGVPGEGKEGRRARAREQVSVVAGAVEAMSTQHQDGGLMERVVERAKEKGVPVVKWCILEVLEKCVGRECAMCALEEDCHGAAKVKCDGFFAIDDAIAMKKRVSLEAWKAEMLCQGASNKGRVFKNFDRGVHVKDVEHSPTMLAMDFGFNNPFVCLWIAEIDGSVFVVDEYVRSERTVDEHVAEIESRRWGHVTRVACDPAGNGRNEQTGESTVARLRKCGFTMRYRGSGIPEGLEMVRAALRPGAGEGEATLFINPRCVKLIKAMECYRYPESGGEIPVKDGVHDHLIDALRYFFVNRDRGEARMRRY